MGTDLTRSYPSLVGFIRSEWVFTGFYWVLSGFVGMEWVLPGFTGF